MAITTTTTVQVIPVGNDVGVLLSPDVLAKLGVKSGDLLSIEATSKEIRLTPGQSAKTLATAKRVMREDVELLRRLAE